MKGSTFGYKKMYLMSNAVNRVAHGKGSYSGLEMFTLAG